MADGSSAADAEAYVAEMLENHTRLIEVTVGGPEDEWEAVKHEYPRAAFEKLQTARVALDVEPVSDPRGNPQPLLGEDGTFTAESCDCAICLQPLLVRPSVEGPFTVGFSLQVTPCTPPFVWLCCAPVPFASN